MANQYWLLISDEFMALGRKSRNRPFWFDRFTDSEACENALGNMSGKISVLLDLASEEQAIQDERQPGTNSAAWHARFAARSGFQQISFTETGIRDWIQSIGNGRCKLNLTSTLSSLLAKAFASHTDLPTIIVFQICGRWRAIITEAGSIYQTDCAVLGNIGIQDWIAEMIAQLRRRGMPTLQRLIFVDPSPDAQVLWSQTATLLGLECVGVKLPGNNPIEDADNLDVLAYVLETSGHLLPDLLNTSGAHESLPGKHVQRIACVALLASIAVSGLGWQSIKRMRTDITSIHALLAQHSQKNAFTSNASDSINNCVKPDRRPDLDWLTLSGQLPLHADLVVRQAVWQQQNGSSSTVLSIIAPPEIFAQWLEELKQIPALSVTEYHIAGDEFLLSFAHLQETTQ